MAGDTARKRVPRAYHPGRSVNRDCVRTAILGRYRLESGKHCNLLCLVSQTDRHGGLNGNQNRTIPRLFPKCDPVRRVRLKACGMRSKMLQRGSLPVQSPSISRDLFRQRPIGTKLHHDIAHNLACRRLRQGTDSMQRPQHVGPGGNLRSHLLVQKDLQCARRYDPRVQDPPCDKTRTDFERGRHGVRIPSTSRGRMTVRVGLQRPLSSGKWSNPPLPRKYPHGNPRGMSCTGL